MGEETAHVPDTSITSLTPSPPLSSSLLHSSPLPPFLPFSSPSLLLLSPTPSHLPRLLAFKRRGMFWCVVTRIGSQCSTTHSRTRRIWYGNTSGCADVCVYNLHVHSTFLILIGVCTSTYVTGSVKTDHLVKNVH